VFAPNYTVTPAIAADLMVIEAARRLLLCQHFSKK
jgi:hypothetical protein